jgi:hypothetical protein
MPKLETEAVALLPCVAVPKTPSEESETVAVETFVCDPVELTLIALRPAEDVALFLA